MAEMAQDGLPTLQKSRQRQSLILVLLCTLLGAAAQVLIKMGASTLGPHPSLVQTALSILTTPTLFAGYALYGVFTALMVLALRHGELSLLYPIIALTYVWVTVLSVVVFHESMNGFKIAGILTIMTGVAILGKGQGR